MIDEIDAVPRSEQANDLLGRYRDLVIAAELAENSGVPGCLIFKPWGYAIWERIQALVDAGQKAEGIDNFYVPLFAPATSLGGAGADEDAEDRDVAVVTHHRLIAAPGGGLVPDPDARLDVPLAVRPSSEEMAAAAMSRSVQSWRDLPRRMSQWANLVRWEPNPIPFIRDREFLAQEGFGAFADRESAEAEASNALSRYRTLIEDYLAIPSIWGIRSSLRPDASEACHVLGAISPGAAWLDLATAHLHGERYAQAAGLSFQAGDGDVGLCHTVRWSISSRIIGALAMIHADEFGVRLPPAVSPYQVVILPKTTSDMASVAVLDRCDRLQAALRDTRAFGEPIRVFVDRTAAGDQAELRRWVAKGVPIVLEVGDAEPGDPEGSGLAVIRRDRRAQALPPETAEPAGALDAAGTLDAVAAVKTALEEIQSGLLLDALRNREVMHCHDTGNWAQLMERVDAAPTGPQWFEAAWAGLESDELVDAAAKARRAGVVIIRAPGLAPSGPCLFTGRPALERIIITPAI